MDDDVADGQLIDVSGVDIASLWTEVGEPSVKTALDWLLTSNAASLNGFNNSI